MLFFHKQAHFCVCPNFREEQFIPFLLFPFRDRISRMKSCKNSCTSSYTLGLEILLTPVNTSAVVHYLIVHLLF